MLGVNHTVLIGNLGEAPEIRYRPSGQCVAHLRVATNEFIKNDLGVLVAHTEWHKVAADGQLAEYARDRLIKGSLVYVEGKNRTRKYKDGYITEIKATRLDGLGNLKEIPEQQSINLSHLTRSET